MRDNFNVYINILNTRITKLLDVNPYYLSVPYIMDVLFIDNVQNMQIMYINNASTLQMCVDM